MPSPCFKFSTYCFYIRLQNHTVEFQFDRHLNPLPICDGKVSFIRLVRPSGRITLLGEKFKVGKRMKHPYGKATIFTRSEQVKVYFRGRIIKQWPYALRK